jgi:hypothetical protein
MRKCPPGVICVENMTLFFIIIIIIVILYLGYHNLFKHVNFTRVNISENNHSQNNHSQNNRINQTGLFPRPSFSFSNVENDVLLNPYQAPLRDNRLFPNFSGFMQNRVPINVPTQSYDTNYRQIGILTRNSGDKETILPLIGRPLMTNRDKWNFYTMSENNNMVKLPVSILKNVSNCPNKSNTYTKCMGQNGCGDLYTGDTVQVAGYNDAFKVTTYENDTPRYIPYL